MSGKAAKGLKVGVIGLGRMGRCLVEGMMSSGAFAKDSIRFTTKHRDTGMRAEEELGLKRVASNAELITGSDVVLLAVKPQNSSEIVAELKGKLKPEQTLISIVASVPTASMEDRLGGSIAVIRAMPNTPAFVGEGITALCLGRFTSDRDWERAQAIFSPAGKVVKVDERHMDAVTGLSGCGPAYIYVVLESLTEAGIKVGLPRDLATQLSAQTVLGAAKMLLQTGRHPASLKDEVTTPAGCTIDGLVELEEGRLRVTLIKAVVRATERARQLAEARTE